MAADLKDLLALPREERMNGSGAVAPRCAKPCCAPAKLGRFRCADESLVGSDFDAIAD